MSDVKLIVIYPRPKDIEAFEKVYQDEHVPMAVEKLSGKTKLVATKVVATPDGTPPPFYRIAEIYFPSLQALQACAQSAASEYFGTFVAFEKLYQEEHVPMIADRHILVLVKVLERIGILRSWIHDHEFDTSHNSLR